MEARVFEVTLQELRFACLVVQCLTILPSLVSSAG